jgi:hypothetical protein
VYLSSSRSPSYQHPVLLCAAQVVGSSAESIVLVAEAREALARLATLHGLHKFQGLPKLWVYVTAIRRCTMMMLFYVYLVPHSEVLPLKVSHRRRALELYEERVANRLTRCDLRRFLAGPSEVARQPCFKAGQCRLHCG